VIRPTARSAGAALVFLAASVAPAAGAETPPAPETGATPSFALLPEGHVPPLPEVAVPMRLAAGEKSAGFAGAPGQGTVINLFPGEEQARAFAASPGKKDETLDACLADGGNADTLARGSNDPDAEREPRDWPSNFGSMISFQLEDKGRNAVVRSKRHKRHAASAAGGEVHAVRAERFVSGQDGHASLEIADAWFDVRTRGVRVIDRATLPLARLFTGPNGLEVYAARDGDAVQLVLHAPDHPSDDAAVADALRSRLRNLSFTLPDRNGASSDCGHARITLRAPAGGGQMATLQSQAFLPVLAGAAGEAPEGETEEARGARLVAAMRQRPFRLSVSTTATSADKTPVLSVALGWSGREQPGG
jgi:hypothetical protein